MIKRAVNVGFSGGEKKRNEVLQMAMLEPKLAVLDETDSGLDIDALKVVADGVNKLRAKDRSFLVITHYQRLLDYIVPDFVHVLAAGKIVKNPAMPNWRWNLKPLAMPALRARLRNVCSGSHQRPADPKAGGSRTCRVRSKGWNWPRLRRLGT